MNFSGKTAIVTGASRGIGAAIAVELGRRGANVVCAARASAANPLRLPGTVDETAQAINEAGGVGLAVPCDLTGDGDIEHLITVTVERFGRLDMLVNNAAVSFGGDLDIPMKRFDVLMRINVRAPLVATRLAQPHLAAAPDGGRILNVGSVTATGYFPTMLTYGMSKAALEHLTVTSAAVLAPDGIAVNCYRIDVQVASEGYVMNAPDADHSTWADTATAADGALWMLSQPTDWTGWIVPMLALAEHVPSIARLGQDQFTPTGPWTIASALGGSLDL
ncbi:MAG: SDR family NAD(P)-dependent oxidoreductase [Acidimicrobiia bacterium]|nr:SDR family NAD(P)-dependent oxidoreductase [Acidimicrobiia bacterium]